MHRLLQLGPYYFLLDAIARFYTARHIPGRTKIVTSFATFLALCALAWVGSEWLTLRVGEYPGSLLYTEIKFKYLMRLLCIESLLVAGALCATWMAQESGKICR